MASRVHERLTKIFEASRTSTGDWPDKPFVQFLVPECQRPVENSFRGCAHKARFFREVEQQSNVVLRLGDYDKNWSFDAFATHIEDRTRQVAQSKRMAQERINHATTYLKRHIYKLLIVFVFTWLLLQISAWFLLPVIPVLAFFCLDIREHIADRRHYSSLLKRLLGAAQTA